MRALVPVLVVGMLGTCAPYEATPTTPLQWQRRQEQIERREAERKAFCAQPARAADASCLAQKPGVQP